MSRAHSRASSAPAAMHPALLMFIAHRDVERRVIERVRAAGFDDLTPAMARIAARLVDGGSRVTDLASASGVTKQTAHALVEQLVAGGYVERRQDDHDRRARLIVFAPRGHQARKVAREVEADVLRQWEAHLGPQELRRLTESLTRLQELTDPV